MRKKRKRGEGRKKSLEREMKGAVYLLPTITVLIVGKGTEAVPHQSSTVPDSHTAAMPSEKAS